jgi:hypothetical protein
MLARKNGCRNGAAAERVIFDEIARTLVLDGARVKKHTKGGRCAPQSSCESGEDGRECWGFAVGEIEQEKCDLSVG